MNVLLPTIIVLAYILAKLLLDEAIFVPTPKKYIRKIFDEIRLSENDLLIDLGSGDGRVLRIAANEYGCRAVGIEKSVILYIISKILSRNNKRIKIILGDLFNTNLKNATVVYAYLSKKLMKNLKQKLENELKHGTIVVSLDHKIPGWKPVKTIKTGHFYTHIYKFGLHSDTRNK